MLLFFFDKKERPKYNWDNQKMNTTQLHSDEESINLREY